MSYNEMKFRTQPSFYSRADVENALLGNVAYQRFVDALDFAIQRFGRAKGKEKFVYETSPVEGSPGVHEVTIYIAGRPDLAEKGVLRGDLLTIEHFCTDYGTRAEFLHLLPRLSRHLIEKEYRPSMRR